MESYVLFKSNKRVVMRQDDLTSTKVCRIFQVTQDTVYLTDDSNGVFFPNEQLQFMTDRFMAGGHYEVHGDDIRNSDDSPRPSTSAMSSPFAFATRPMPPSNAPAAIRSIGVKKSFSRSLQLVEPVGSNLVVTQTLYLRLLETEMNIPAVAAKCQEQLDGEETMVITDVKGQELIDSVGTQGPEFWRNTSRKVYCMASGKHIEWTRSRRSKYRRSETMTAVPSAASAELTENIEDNLAAGRQLKQVLDELLIGTGSHMSHAIRPHLQVLKDNLNCSICREIVTEPMFASCCRTIIGCRICMEAALTSQTTCPRCRHENARQMIYSMRGGMEETMAAIGGLLSLFP